MDVMLFFDPENMGLDILFITLHPFLLTLEQKINFSVMAEQKWPPYPPQSKSEVALYPNFFVQPYSTPMPNFMLSSLKAQFCHILHISAIL